MLADFHKIPLAHPAYNINNGSKSHVVKQLFEHVFICSFQKVSLSRVTESLSDFKSDRECKEFVRSMEETVPRVSIAGNIELYVLGGEFGEYDKGYRFIVVNPKNPPNRLPLELKEVSWTRHTQAPATGVLKVERVKKIPRHIYIYRVDDIRSERDFNELFSQVVKRINSEFV